MKDKYSYLVFARNDDTEKAIRCNRNDEIVIINRLMDKGWKLLTINGSPEHTEETFK